MNKDNPNESEKILTSQPIFTSLSYEIERSLFIKIMDFDLNLGKMPGLTIAKRLARENTNDAGDELSNYTANIIMIEFKKFMFLNLLRIL